MPYHLAHISALHAFQKTLEHHIFVCARPTQNFLTIDPLGGTQWHHTLQTLRHSQRSQRQKYATYALNYCRFRESYTYDLETRGPARLCHVLRDKLLSLSWILYVWPWNSRSGKVMPYQDLPWSIHEGIVMDGHRQGKKAYAYKYPLTFLKWWSSLVLKAFTVPAETTPSPNLFHSSQTLLQIWTSPRPNDISSWTV